jgi:predicted signal transduction protein with EAL and GGDEF domain
MIVLYNVRFKSLTAVKMSMLVFCFEMLCVLVGRYRYFEERYYSIFGVEDGKRAEDRNSMFLRNAGICLQAKLNPEDYRRHVVQCFK